MADYENRLSRLEEIATKAHIERIRIMRTIIDPEQQVTSVRAEELAKATQFFASLALEHSKR